MNKQPTFEVIDGYAEAQKKTADATKVLTKKAEKPKAIIPVKTYWDIKVETMVPATLTYRVLAEDPMKAAEMIKMASPTNVKYRLMGKKDLKLTVYEAGTNMIKWIKNLVGR